MDKTADVVVISMLVVGNIWKLAIFFPCGCDARIQDETEDAIKLVKITDGVKTASSDTFHVHTRGMHM
jgi:hypothetical protein